MPAWHIFKEAAKTLDQAAIDFLLCGGIAVRLYGRLRDTGDVDFLIRESDREKALQVLSGVGFDIKRTDPRWLFQAFKDDTKVDLIFEAKGAIRLTEEVLERSHTQEIGGYTYRIISAEDLLVMKAHSMSEERPRDLYDALSIMREANEQIDWYYFLERSRPRAKRMLALLLFAQSEQPYAPHVPDWVVHRMISYLPT